jgi:hypothetical protein
MQEREPDPPAASVARIESKRSPVDRLRTVTVVIEHYLAGDCRTTSVIYDVKGASAIFCCGDWESLRVADAVELEGIAADAVGKHPEIQAVETLAEQIDDI